MKIFKNYLEKTKEKADKIHVKKKENNVPKENKKVTILKEVSLKVVEALQDDAYKGIARIDSEAMRILGIKRGDVVSIKGSRETVAVADRAYPADVGEGIIRIDGILRRNARAGIGDVVSISKVEIVEAKKVMIAPAEKGIRVQGDPESLKRGLLGRAIIKGDILVLGQAQKKRDVFSEMGMDDELGGLFGNMLSDMGMGNSGGGITQIRFMVVSTNPSQPCVITENTEVSLNPTSIKDREKEDTEISPEEEAFNAGITVDKIIHIKELPALNNFLEMKNLEDLSKLAKAGYFVSKFETKDEIIYLSSNYFYRQLKRILTPPKVLTRNIAEGKSKISPLSDLESALRGGIAMKVLEIDGDRRIIRLDKLGMKNLKLKVGDRMLLKGFTKIQPEVPVTIGKTLSGKVEALSIGVNKELKEEIDISGGGYCLMKKAFQDEAETKRNI